VLGFLLCIQFLLDVLGMTEVPFISICFRNSVCFDIFDAFAFAAVRRHIGYADVRRRRPPWRIPQQLRTGPHVVAAPTQRNGLPLVKHSRNRCKYLLIIVFISCI